MPHKLVRLSVSLVLVTAVSALVPRVAASDLDAKRGQAAALESRIRAQGRRLSLADEAFNAARLQRQQTEARADTARSMVITAEHRWEGLRSQLGRRARLLYMHPGAALDAFFGARTLGEVARARVYGGEVLMTDSQLVMDAERARHEVMERAKTLDALRIQAQRKQREQAARRTQVEKELGAQRALLSNVKGDIAKIIEADRKAALEAAARQASAAQSSVSRAPASGGPAIGDSSEAKAIDEPAPDSPPPSVRASAAKAVETARAQIGKPYEWGAGGPDSFDCSGLTSYAWSAAGVSLPHSSGAQYSSLPHVSRSQLAPGDLVFFGSPIHHVGIYEGAGMMINAPETGENVRRDSISRSDYVGAARP
jgi:cell wall-associated NlpC family hydrolase